MANAWTTFVTKHYRQMKKTNPSYKFKHALKDAGKLYNKTMKLPSNMMRMGRGQGKSRKNRKNRK
jgi:hypothetical protein